jgi:hypothetical protein
MDLAPVRRLSALFGGITDALGQIVRNDFRGYSFSATLLIPLSNRAPQAEHARAQADRRTEENRKAATASLGASAQRGYSG